VKTPNSKIQAPEKQGWGNPIKTVYCFPNLSMACCDEAGQQIPALQENLLILWAQYAERRGFDPEGLVIHTISQSLRLVRNHDRSWNLEHAPDAPRPRGTAAPYSEDYLRSASQAPALPTGPPQKGGQ